MMKKILTTIGLAFAMLIPSAYPQTNSVADTNSISVTNSAVSPWKQTLSSFSWSSVASISNYSFEPYFTYAPDVKVSSKYGGGILALYNLNNYVAGGIGIDYLGQFSLFSGNLTLKLPIIINKYVMLPSPFDNLEIVPFTLGGIATPMSAVTSSPIMVWSAGGLIKFGHLWGGRFNTGAAYGSWENAGDYTGKRINVFVGWSKDF